MQAAKCAIAVGETVRAIVARTMAVIAVLTAFAGGAAMAQSAAQPAVQNSAQINAADTAWMMAATALVLMMTIPGLALFYAGMVRKKNVLATMAQSLAATALCSILWAALGYTLGCSAATLRCSGAWIVCCCAAWRWTRSARSPVRFRNPCSCSTR
jgi:hypothetical protein